MSIKTWFSFYCTFCLQTGSGFLTIESKKEKPDTDDGDANSDSDSADEGVNKCNILSHQKYIAKWAHFRLALI